MKKFVLSLVFCLCAFTGARADEGMWLIQSLNKALEKNTKARGLKLSAREIYNEEAGGVSDAIISLGFYCTGSMISDEGLMITNHHCAYSDISALSTPEHNYLEEGFWALSRDKEIPIPGKQVFFLRKVLDVTEEVVALKDSLQAAGLPSGSRRISSIMEGKYAKSSGLEAGLTSMWAGEKYYMSLYTVYTDVRLVGAPPVSVAAFGGDEDNWEWPQHKADFALYRVYTAPDGSNAAYAAGNIPLKPRRHLKISTKGYKEGDYAMVIGYPGHTARYSSAAEMSQTINVEHPVSNRLRAKQMEIIRQGMEADPEIRRKYSDAFFSLSNVAELQEGEVKYAHRFQVIERRRAEEQATMQPEYAKLLQDLEAEYAAISDLEQQKVYYRETLVRGLIISRTLMRMGSAKDNLKGQKNHLRTGLNETDPAVERALLAFSVKEFMTHIHPRFFQPIHREMKERFGEDYEAMAAWLWDNSCLADFGKKDVEEIVEAYAGGILEDPLYRYIRELSIVELNNAEKHVADLPELRRNYVRARYDVRNRRGIPQYPDANSTMRLTYGRVCSLKPFDGAWYSWQSTAAGLREKYDPGQYDFAYPDAFKAVLPPEDFPINFLTDNDITGGNSGSPVLNARGELIGLAFDGNKESLASNYEAVDGYNKCVCVDIRYVLWVIRYLGGLEYLLQEVGQ